MVWWHVAIGLVLFFAATIATMLAGASVIMWLAERHDDDRRNRRN